MQKSRSGEEAFFYVLFSDDLWKHLRKWMFPGRKSCNFEDYRDGDIAILHEYTSLVLQNKQLTFCYPESLYFAALNNNLTILRFLVHTQPNIIRRLIIDAIRTNNLFMLKSIYTNNIDVECFDVILAIIDGNELNMGHILNYLDIVKWTINKITPSSKIKSAIMKNAIKHGRLDVLHYLYNNGVECYTSLSKLIYNVHINSFIIMYKYEIIIDGLNDIIQECSISNRMDILQFLETEVMNFKQYLQAMVREDSRCVSDAIKLYFEIQ